MPNNKTLFIQEGMLQSPSHKSKIPVCEFGIGSNYHCKFINYSEKAFNTCHLGFGSNIEFGGTYDLNYHFDIIIHDFTLILDHSKVNLELCNM